MSFDKQFVRNWLDRIGWDHESEPPELPDDVVVKIPLGENEVQELARRVGVLLADRQRLEEMSQAARAYIAEQHEPAQAASSIVQACRELAELPPPGEGTPSLAPPSTLVWRQVWGELDVQGGEPPWQEGQARDLDIHLTNHSSARWLPTGEGTGGVMIELEWRPDPWSGPMEPRWIELPAAIGPGESRSFQIRVRRPLGAGMLVVEPHLQGVSGMNALGGPRWVKFL